MDQLINQLSQVFHTVASFVYADLNFFENTNFGQKNVALFDEKLKTVNEHFRSLDLVFFRIQTIEFMLITSVAC